MVTMIYLFSGAQSGTSERPASGTPAFSIAISSDKSSICGFLTRIHLVKNFKRCASEGIEFFCIVEYFTFMCFFTNVLGNLLGLMRLIT